MIAFHDGAAAPERPTLLVVDDEEHVRFAMQTYFGAGGFRVETAATLDAAKDALARACPAAVVADLRLTGTDGEEGLELLRHTRDARGALPFVLITGCGSARVLAEATRLGVSAMLTKPKPLADIARVVRALLPAPTA